MSPRRLYTYYMKREQNRSNSHPFFSVTAKTLAGKIHIWNFIQPSDHSIIFAGKTLLTNKGSNRNQTHSIKNTYKADFIIEADITYPSKEYTFLPSQLAASAFVEVRHCRKCPNNKVFAWFANIAPLLLAIENNDSLLAAEIFHNKSHILMHFPATTIKLLENIAVEGLFSWVWGRFDATAMENLQAIYNGKCTKHFEQWGVAEAFFTAARRRLYLNQRKSKTIEECITQYLSTHPGTKITLGIVGSNHYRLIEKSLYEAQETKKDANKIFSNAKTYVQAEIDNAHDKNALALYFEIEEKPVEITKTISGYIRKTGAEVLRKASPKKLKFPSRLARLGYLQGGSTGIVIEIIV